MQLFRIFSNEKYKGTKGYLKAQKKYEILRTVLYFAISLLLFAAGWIATGDKMNLLTVVAVLGCLPASKSAVGMIMFLRHKGCSEDNARDIAEHLGSLKGLYDCVFTSYEKNYEVAHIAVKGDTICGFSENKDFEEQAFYKHIDSILKLDNFKDTSVKIFTDKRKYLERLDSLNQLDADQTNTEGILNTLRSVSL